MKQSKSIPYSVLDLVPITKNANPADSLKRSLKLAQTAEALRYKRFWLAEHHNMPNIASAATTLLMGYIAGGTKDIRIGSGGIMLPNHSPLIVAEQIGTLAQLYPGRIDLGLGRAPGTDQITAKAIRSDREYAVYNFDHEIDQLQNYFGKDNSGKTVRSFLSEGTDVPFWLLGSSTDSAYLAAKMGLPYVFASHFAPDDLMNSLAIYRKMFKPSATLKQPYTIACIQQITAPTQEEADFLSSSMKLSFLGILTGQREPMQPPQEINDHAWGIFKNRLDHMLQYAIVGDPEQTRKELTQFIEQTRIDEIMISSSIYEQEKHLRSLELFSEVARSISH